MLLELLIRAVCKMHVKNNMNLVCNLALCIEPLPSVSEIIAGL